MLTTAERPPELCWQEPASASEAKAERARLVTMKHEIEFRIASPELVDERGRRLTWDERQRWRLEQRACLLEIARRTVFLREFIRARSHEEFVAARDRKATALAAGLESLGGPDGLLRALYRVARRVLDDSPHIELTDEERQILWHAHRYTEQEP